MTVGAFEGARCAAPDVAADPCVVVGGLAPAAATLSTGGAGGLGVTGNPRAAGGDAMLRSASEIGCCVSSISPMPKTAPTIATATTASAQSESMPTPGRSDGARGVCRVRPGARGADVVAGAGVKGAGVLVVSGIEIAGIEGAGPAIGAGGSGTGSPCFGRASPSRDSGACVCGMRVRKICPSKFRCSSSRSACVFSGSIGDIPMHHVSLRYGSC